VLCALLFATPLAWSQQSPRTWSPIFDKIQDPDVLQTLHSYEKRGWDVAFRTEGKSAEQLILEGGMEQRRLQAAIDRDQFLLATLFSHVCLGNSRTVQIGAEKHSRPVLPRMR